MNDSTILPQKSPVFMQEIPLLVKNLQKNANMSRFYCAKIQASHKEQYQKKEEM